jgi:hypothetical protein
MTFYELIIAIMFALGSEQQALRNIMSHLFIVFTGK